MTQTSGPEDRTDRLVDAVGLTCPMPVLLTRKALRALPEGAEIEVRASDPLSRVDIPHFCAQNGHALLGHREHGGVWIFRLRKGRDAAENIR